MLMRRMHGSYQKLRANGLGENPSIGPVLDKTVQVAIACAKYRVNVSFLQYVCSWENKFRAKINIKNSASKRGYLCQSVRIRNRFYGSKDFRSSIS